MKSGSIDPVAQHRDDDVPGPMRRPSSMAPGDVDAAGGAEAQALVLEQVEDVAHRVGVGDQEGLVDTSPIGDLAVMRPWPMPSVIEEPSAFSSPVV
jgi:hypothetical protein